VQPYLWNAAVAVAPLHESFGLQNKVLEALAAGLPVVTTTAVAAGLPGEALPGCSVRDNPASFAEAVVDMLAARPAERRAVAASSRLDLLDWSAQLKPLEGMVREAANR
jgi:glycosyltransferase involved in cell wall biosynthesis